MEAFFLRFSRHENLCASIEPETSKSEFAFLAVDEVIKKVVFGIKLNTRYCKR